MLITGEIYYCESSRNRERKYHIEALSLEASDFVDSVTKIAALFERKKALLPVAAADVRYGNIRHPQPLESHCVLNCVVLRTYEPLIGQTENFKLVFDKKLDAASRFSPRPIDGYTAAEKIAEFEKLHKFAMSIWNDRKEGKRDDDEDHWCYESVMALLAYDNKSEFWDAFNALEGSR